MRKPARSTREPIAPTNASYGVRRTASSKCWTTVTATPAAVEELQALGRMEQERRRRSADDLVGMVVEGDHRGASVAFGCLAREVVQQVGVPAVDPVEHADDDEQSCRGRR